MSQVVTWAIALLALVVSVATYRLNVRDRRHAWEAQERAQAEEVAGWLVREMCEEHKEMEWKAYVRNSSKSPVYDVLYVIHDSQDLDAAMPEMIPLIPPDTTWDFFPTWFGNQPEGNPRVYMTFRDKRGEAWQRDTHGRLTPFRRNVDNAPPADPVSGRISYGMRNQAAGLASSGRPPRKRLLTLWKKSRITGQPPMLSGCGMRLSPPDNRRLTTKVDHNDMRHSPIERVTREANSQVSDGNRHGAGSLQARIRPTACA